MMTVSIPTMLDEHVTIDPADDTLFVCPCGNRACDAGMYPISEVGDERGDREVEPTTAAWTSGEYVCAACGRVIDQARRVVTRRVDLANFAWLD